MSGLFARLRDNPNLEEVKPAEISFTVEGHEIVGRIFAFKPGKSITYRQSEGILFAINGQTHGYMKSSFFARDKVGLRRLAKDLLVVLDCSSLSAIEQDDLFMPSRDRLVEDDVFAVALERALERELKDHQGLRNLRNLRAQLDMEEKLADNKPLEDVLKSVLNSSPYLARIFGTGPRLQNPFKPAKVQTDEEKFEGKPHPTYFRFLGKEAGIVLSRTAHIGSRVRLTLETDVVDEYFTRRIDAGEKELVQLIDGARVPVTNFSGPNLSSGRVTLTLELPDHAVVDDRLSYELVVRDPAMGDEFVNVVEIIVGNPQKKAPGPPRKPRRNPSKNNGGDVDGADGLALPEVIWVSRDMTNWDAYFDSPHDCLTVMFDGADSEDEEGSYKYYLNEDNPSLQNELKSTKFPVSAVKKQFEIGVTLIGMALIFDKKQSSPENETTKERDATNEEDDAVYRQISSFTRAAAPAIIPMIQGLSDLGEMELDLSDQVGEAA